MKKIILSTLFIVFTIININSYGFEGPICVGDITLSSQADVDAFNCIVVEGTLRISGEDITNLNALSSLRKVGQLFISQNTYLTNIDGLISLDSIDGAILNIGSNSSLENIDGLSSLSFLGSMSQSGALNISDNGSLQNINGLSSLTQIYWPNGGILYIEYNEVLSDINGLSALTSEGVPFIDAMRTRVTRNQMLSACAGLTPLFNSLGVDKITDLYLQGNIVIAENGESCTLNDILPAFPDFERCLESITLTSQADVNAFDCPLVGGTLRISGADITDLSSLSVLRRVGSLVIENNPNLRTLDGLSSLDAIQGFNESFMATLQISNNALLENIDGLSSLSMMEAHFYTTIEIDNNPSLTNLNGLSSMRGFYWVKDGFIVITNNETLSDINGLSSLRITGTHMTSNLHLDISHNPQLKLCNDLFPFLKSMGGQSFGKNSSVRIEENGEGCTLENILAYDPDELCVGKSLRTQEEVNDFFCRNLKSTLTISGDDIVDLEPLLILQKVGDGLVIEGNPNLANIYGLSSLDSIAGGLYDYGELRIRNNSSLTNIDGLSSLTSFVLHSYSYIEITNNSSLQNIDGLSSLARFDWGKDGGIKIADNAALTNIDGLASLRARRPQLYEFMLYISVKNNPMLTRCSGLYPFLSSLTPTSVSEMIARGNIQISGNGGGCTIEDILASGPQSIFDFSVFNKLSGQSEYFYDSITLDVANPAFLGWSLQAHTFPEKVGSVEFIFPNKNRQMENNPPYTFDIPSRSKLGKNIVQVDVYSQANKKGEKGIGRTATIILINSASVASFDLVDASGQLIRPLVEGDRIDIKDPVFKSIHIRGNTLPENVSSVKFWLNGQFVRRENGAPYAFNGNNDKGYYPWTPTPGDYTLLAIPYIKHGNKEYPGKALTVHFSVEAVESSMAIVGFDVVDTSGKLLQHLYDGDMINLEDSAFKAFNVVANTTGQVGSVNFWLNDKSYRTENNEPYTLAGDQNGKYNAWSPQIREYKLSAIPHAEPNAKGPFGKSLIIHFRVVEEMVSSAYRLSTLGSDEESLEVDKGIWAYPIPVDKELHVKMDDAAGPNAILVIMNSQGLTVYQNPYSTSKTINTAELKPGVYFLHILGNNGFRKVLKIIKE